MLHFNTLYLIIDRVTILATYTLTRHVTEK